LFVLPHTMIDRRKRYPIAEAPENAVVTLEVSIDYHQPAPPGNRSAAYRIFAHDNSGEIALTFFRAKGDWLTKAVPEGARMIVSGRIEWFNGRASMVHPDHMVPADRADDLPAVEPVYPLTAGLSSKVLRKAVAASVNRLPELPEWLDRTLMSRPSFPSIRSALHRVNTPDDPLDINPDSAAWRRLAYDELLAGQLALALVRARVRRNAGRALTGDGRIEKQIRTALPYSLTHSQEHALAEIHGDLELPN